MLYQKTLEGKKIIPLDELTLENADKFAEVHPIKFAEYLNDAGVFYNKDCGEDQLSFAKGQLKEIFGIEATKNMLDALIMYGMPCNKKKEQDLIIEEGDDEEDLSGVLGKIRAKRNLSIYTHINPLGIISH